MGINTFLALTRSTPSRFHVAVRVGVRLTLLLLLLVDWKAETQDIFTPPRLLFLIASALSLSGQGHDRSVSLCIGPLFCPLVTLSVLSVFSVYYRVFHAF